MFNNQKQIIMETIKMNISDYTNQIKLGYLEQVKSISVYIKLIKKYDLKGGFELKKIQLTF